MEFHIRRQPDDTTCGPTCLHAVYRYFDDELPLEQIIGEVSALAEGGTLGALLAVHALRRGYRATLYTYNLEIFDPSWFALDRSAILAKLREQLEAKPGRSRLRAGTEAYVEFLELGGELRFVDLTSRLLRKLLDRELPVLTGLSSTFLYREPREIPETGRPDDLRGEPAGHFVVLVDYDEWSYKVHMADPFHPNPFDEDESSPRRIYQVPIDRVVNAILLGVLTYDANLLQIEPGPWGRRAVREREAAEREIR